MHEKMKVFMFIHVHSYAFKFLKPLRFLLPKLVILIPNLM